MGQTTSKDIELVEERRQIKGDILANVLDFPSCESMKASLSKRDTALALLASGTNAVTKAQLLHEVHVGDAEIMLEDIPNLFTFGDKIRRTGSALIKQLSKSFFEGGIITKGAGDLTVYLDFEEGKQGIQAVAIGGHHRAEAAVHFLNAQRHRDVYEWADSPWIDENGNMKVAFVDSRISVTFLYLGKAEIPSMAANVALALNHSNIAVGATTFFDKLTLVSELLRKGCSQQDILSKCAEFKGNKNTARSYVAALKRLANNKKVFSLLGAYNDSCVDTSLFFIESKFHSDKTLKELHSMLGTELGDIFFVKFALKCQPRNSDDTLVCKHTKEGRADMLSCAGLLVPVLDGLRTKLSGDTAKNKIGVAYDLEGVVTTCVSSVLDRWDAFHVDADGQRSKSSNNALELLPMALSEAVWSDDRPRTTKEAEARLHICRGVLNADHVGVNKAIPTPTTPQSPTSETDVGRQDTREESDNQSTRGLDNRTRIGWEEPSLKQSPTLVDTAPSAKSLAGNEQRGVRTACQAPKPRVLRQVLCLPSRPNVPNPAVLHPDSDDKRKMLTGGASSACNTERQTVNTPNYDTERQTANTRNLSNEGESSAVKVSGPESSSTERASEAPAEEANRDGVPNSPRRRHQVDQTHIILDELNPDTVWEAVTQSYAPHGLSVLVWDVGRSGDLNLLTELIGCHSKAKVPEAETTRILIVDDPRGDNNGGSPRRKTLVEATIAAAVESMKVLNGERVDVSYLRLEARMEGAHFQSTKISILRGRTSERAVSPEPWVADKIDAYIVMRGEPKVALDEKDPSLGAVGDELQNPGTVFNPRVLRGRRICRMKDTPPGGFEMEDGDEEWDAFLSGNKGKRKRGRSVRTSARMDYPTVDTLKGLLFRSGATLNNGVVVITLDPFAAWVEACASIEVSTVSFVANKPPIHVKDKILSMWRRTTGYVES